MYFYVGIGNEMSLNRDFDPVAYW